MLYLQDIHAVALGLILVVGSVGLALLGLILTHRYLPESSLRPNHEMGGLILNSVSIIYGVILGFVVIAAWEGHSRADRLTDQEANALSDLYRVSVPLGPELRQSLGLEILDYMRVVIDTEWTYLAEAKESPLAQTQFVDLWRQLYAYAPRTEAEKIWYSQAVDAMQRASDARRDRIIESRAAVPQSIWVFLIGGGILMVGFTYLFTSPIRWAQLFMTGSLAALIAGSIFLMFEMNYAFRGDLKILPTAFENAIKRVTGTL